MACSSCSTHIKRYHVFPSFHGPDVRKGFLSHLRNHFKSKGITTFNDQKIERGHTIAPELVQAIRESRVSIVLLSKKYASSSWCLDELVEIFKCKEEKKQIVMTIFYQVDPFDVRKQRGDFGSAFDKTCTGRTEEVKQSWKKALTDVANIEGEHYLNWANEAEMIQQIATDVSKKLNLTTPSRDFEGMVGMEAHLTKLNSLLCLESDEVKMVGIWGPAGIGKTTIARVLYNQLSSSFPLKYFMGNLKGSLKSRMGVDDYESKKSLQQQLLSKIFSQENMEIHNLGAIKEWLQDQKVLIILDDVDDQKQLEVLAKEPSWFGLGSRIIITTEDKKILKGHGILEARRVHDIYHVDFPSMKEAIEILCLSAFEQSSVPDGFEKLANKVAELCGNLPLGLCVIGSSLRGDSKDKWERQLSRIEASLDGNIEDVLKVGYDRLTKKNQSLFLHIACFFNNEDVGYVESMLSDSNLDVGNGLKTLAYRSLVRKSTNGRIVMHHLLQQLGRQIDHEKSDEPGGRQFLTEAEEIRDVLTNETGTESVIGVSFDTSNMGKVLLSKGAFKGMRNLHFLRIKKYSIFGGKKNDDFHIPEDDFLSLRMIINKERFSSNLQIPEDMDLSSPLRLLDWDCYPIKSLPRKFQPERLVELHMPRSNLENLWKGIKPLPNLKSINLSFSSRLKEIPNLSNATNLETLTLTGCESLVELPSSIKNLHKLKELNVDWCSMLQVIPTNINLASLERIDMSDCSRLRTFPEISKNIKRLNLGHTDIKDVPPSVAEYFSRLGHLNICSRSLKRLTHVPLCITELFLDGSSIEMIPECVIRLQHLELLDVEKCRKLVTIQGLPPSLRVINANDCVSLKSVCFSFHNPTKALRFHNCLKLDEESRRRIIHESIYDHVCLPGKKIPAEFTHKATRRSITIPLAPGTLSASSRFKACFLFLPVDNYDYKGISCSIRSKGGVTVNNLKWSTPLSFESKHLVICHGNLFRQRSNCHEVDVTMSEVDMTMSEITFEFNYKYEWDKIIECGVQIMTEEAEGSSSREFDSYVTESSSSQVDYYETESSSEEDNFEKGSISSAVDYYETGSDDNHSSDEDEDGDYEAEGFKFFQDENIKTSKHTGLRSWLRKLGLKVKR